MRTRVDELIDEIIDKDARIEELKADRKALRGKIFYNWPGCTDGNCVVRGPAKGMHTNGKCNCLLYASCGQLQILTSRLQILLGVGDE